jgi:hypothetical protein
MSAVYGNGAHSRSSSETNIPDLEKGEVQAEKDEEEHAEDKVTFRELHTTANR